MNNTSPADAAGFPREDYALVAAMLRSASRAGNGRSLYAILSNNLNVVLAALDLAAAP